MKKEKPRNQNGDTPSDEPSKELTHPPKQGGGSRTRKRESDKNTTAKDPNLGGRNTVR